jgi:hypothetical protein
MEKQGIGLILSKDSAITPVTSTNSDAYVFMLDDLKSIPEKHLSVMSRSKKITTTEITEITEREIHNLMRRMPSFSIFTLKLMSSPFLQSDNFK